MTRESVTLINNEPAQNLPHFEEFISKDTGKISGRIGFIRLNSGINLHFSDITELVNDASVRMSGADLTISLLLEGEVEFFMNDQPYFLGSQQEDRRATDNDDSTSSASGKIWSLTEPVKFARMFKRGRMVKKIIISIDRDWLANMGLAETLPSVSSELDKNLVAFAGAHLQYKEWFPSKRAIKVAEDIIDPPHEAECMRQMVREAAALELVTLAFRSFSESYCCTKAEISTPDNCRLIKVHSYIEDNLGRELALEEIAKNVGFSVSSLQRHFKTTYGSTVVEYIRKRKLERAKDALQNESLSISEACFLAGYSSHSSFTTAFKRAFGHAPKAFLKLNKR